MNALAEKEIPAGYMMNSLGGLTPTNKVAEIDKLRDNVVRDIVMQARALQDQMIHFKTTIFEDIETFVKISAEQYGAQVGGVKGNITLTTFDGKYKVVVQNQERLSFDERLQIAKCMVDNCIKCWEEKIRAGGMSSEAVDVFENMMVIARGAFQVDKAGQFNRTNLINLTKYQIKDPEWLLAMKAIIDAQAIVGSKLYLRVSERIGGNQKWEHIALDMASL